MRISIVEEKGNAFIPYDEEISPREHILDLVKEKYKTTAYHYGKVLEVISIEIPEYLNLVRSNDGIRLNVPYIAKLKIAYLRMGDVLFNVKIEKLEEFSLMKKVTGYDSPFDIIMETELEEENANIIITDFIRNAPQKYMAELAIYPKWHPIEMGISMDKIIELEPVFYKFDGKNPKNSLALDPYYEKKDRIKDIIQKIILFLGIMEKPLVAIKGYNENTRYTPTTKLTDKPIIEFTQLCDLEDLIKLRNKTRKVRVLFHPIMELFKEYAIVVSSVSTTFRTIESAEINWFILKVKEYIDMKKIESTHKSQYEKHKNIYLRCAKEITG